MKLELKFIIHFYPPLMWRMKAGIWMNWAEKLRASHAVPESKISWNSIQEAFYAEWLFESVIS